MTVSDRPQSGFDRPDGWAAPGAALVRSAATDPVPRLADLGRVHIIGIAGAGMSGLARILLARGLVVSGCEARPSDTVEALRAQNARISIGHHVDHLDAVDTVIYSTAIPSTHLELVEARRRGLQVLRRAAGLAAALDGKRGIAVAGTHGKTTTTSLLTVALQTCGLDPSFAIGGNLYETGRNAHFGSGEYAVIEADESDGSFLLLRPEIAIVTNVEADHLENHGDLEGVHWAFEQFVDRIVTSDRVTSENGALDGSPERGVLVVCADDAGSARTAAYARSLGVRVITYGTAQDADVRVTQIVTEPASVTFAVSAVSAVSAVVPAISAGLDARTVTVGALVGRHMALNATAALTVAALLGLDLDRVGEVWRDFQGVKRRFEFRGTAAGVRVYDDYAHHPTEITAALLAAQAATGAGRLIAVFQPGTYSRTQTFAAEFGTAMALADVAVVMDVFASREEPLPGVTGALIADAVPLAPENVIYEPRWSDVAARVAALAEPGDVVVTMGIGDVHLLCGDILAHLDADQAGAVASASLG